MTSGPAHEMRTETLGDRRGIRLTVVREGRPVTWAEVMDLWRAEEPFRRAFTRALTAVPFDAMFWESVPVSAASRGRTFECALIDCPALTHVTPSSRAFAEHLRSEGEEGSVVTFPNLGGDALLIVPRRLGPEEHYPHLLAFLRGAPADQVDQLWSTVGRALSDRVARDPGPCWVSTSGLGVYWVHVRLDSTPKYYTHAPYRSAGS